MVNRRNVEVSVTLTKALLDAAVALGVERNQILKDCGLEPHILENADNRISFDLQEKIWLAAVEHSGIENFGLKVGNHIEPGSFNVLGYIAMSSANLAEVLQHVQIYQHIVGQGGQIDVLPGKNGSILFRYSPINEGKSVTHQRVAALLASWCKLGHWLVDGFAVEKISFTKSAPTHPEEYEQQLRTRVLFNQAQNELVLSEQVLSAPIKQANSSLCQLLKAQADALIGQLNQDNSITHKVVLWIRDHLIDGEPDKSCLAQSLNISPRTLQRKLAEENTSFQQLVNDIRRQLAEDYLAHNELSTGEIAYLLGFSEPSNFYRAYKKWTGKTPSQYREHLAITPKA